MATYAIGDVQGCASQLDQLVRRIGFDAQTDRLWFVGDLVNRGPDSVGVLRFIKSLEETASVVLGNHDLFLLAAAEELVSLRPKDTIHDVLAARDRSELTAWLRHQPLVFRDDAYLMVHAGLLPTWTADEAFRLAREVEHFLAGPDYRTLLRELFHEPTVRWHASLRGLKRLAAITRIFTKIRTCTVSGDLSNFSGRPDEAPQGYRPWFSFPDRQSADVTIIAGHWAALGLHVETNLLMIDSGCVWGRELTALRVSDRAVFQVPGLAR